MHVWGPISSLSSVMRTVQTPVSVNSLSDLYASLDVPDTDVRSAWNLVNPSASSTINKDATLAFLHMLNYRHEGYRMPRSVPPSLRASFERAQIDYRLNNSSAAASRWATKADDETPTGKKAKFGDQYLTRLGKSSFKTAGTDFTQAGASRTDDWEEVRLRRQLQELDDKLRRAEELVNSGKRGGRGGSGGPSKSALVKRELQDMLDFKRGELRDLQEGKGKQSGGDASLKNVRDDLATVREQVEGLESHLRAREAVLEQIRREIEQERAGGR